MDQSVDQSPVVGVVAPVTFTEVPAPVVPVDVPASIAVRETVSASPVVAPVVPEPVAPVITPEVLVPPVVVVSPSPVDTNTDPMATISLVGKMAYQNILDYMVAMAPKKPIQIETGCRHQTRLYSSILSIINNLDSDFNTAYGALLKLVHDNRDGVFHETQIFRFMEHIALPANDRKAFTRLINLMKVTADPKGRELSLKQVSLKNSLEFGITESGLQRMMAFYHQK